MTGAGRWTPDTHTPRDFGDVPNENDYTYRKGGKNGENDSDDASSGDDPAAEPGDRER